VLSNSGQDVLESPVVEGVTLVEVFWDSVVVRGQGREEMGGEGKSQ